MKQNATYAVLFFLTLLTACSQSGPDNVEFTAANLVQNGSFDGTSSWETYIESPMTGQLVTEDGMGKFNVQNSDGTYWKAQLYQDVNVQSGREYTLSFKAKATANRPLQVAVRSNATFQDAWSETLELTTSLKTFSYAFTTSVSKPQLIFYAGHSSKDFFLDDVTLSAGSSTPPNGGGGDEGGTPPNNGDDTPPNNGGGGNNGAKLAPSQSEAERLNDKMYDKFKASLSSGAVPQQAEQFNNGIVSEGVGYGMLLAVLNGDQDTFDRFWDFAKSNLADYDDDGVGDLLPWKFNSGGGVESSGNATDGDLDIAFALLVADKKGWGGSYGTDARKHIDNMMEWNVSDDNVLQEGRWTYTDESVINTSYLSPAYFKAFADYTGENRWLKVRDKSYEILQNGFDKGYKVMPHNINVNGNLASDRQTYNSDAARGPWRLAMDYLWYGDSRAEALLKKYNAFFEGEGLSDLCGEYDVETGEALGSAQGRWCGSDAGYMIGGAACAQLADGNAKAEAWNALTTAFDGAYYNRELKALAMKMCSGYMGNPAN